MIYRFYRWLGKQDLNDLIFRHGAYQKRHRCMIYFDTYIYGQWLKQPDEELMTASIDFADLVGADNKSNNSKFDTVYPDVVEQVKLGNTRARDIAEVVDVSPRTVVAWIEKGWISGEFVKGGKGGGTWHVTI